MKPESLLLLLLMGGLLFMLFSRSRRQQRAAQQLQAELVVGAEVMTTAGLYATVVAIEDSVLVLQTSPGQTSRWDRRVVAKVLPQENPADDNAGDDAQDPERGEPGANVRDTGREEGDEAAGTAVSSQESAPPDRA